MRWEQAFPRSLRGRQCISVCRKALQENSDADALVSKKSASAASMQKLWHLGGANRSRCKDSCIISCNRGVIQKLLHLVGARVQNSLNLFGKIQKFLHLLGGEYKNSCIFYSQECDAKILACNFWELRLESPRFRFQLVLQVSNGAYCFFQARIQLGGERR